MIFTATGDSPLDERVGSQKNGQQAEQAPGAQPVPTKREMLKWFAAILSPDPEDWVEIRALDVHDPKNELTIGVHSTKHAGGQVAAMVNQAIALAAKGNGNARGVYWTINPVTPRTRGAAKDQNIRRRRILLVDIDPRRAADVSATDAEKAAALVVALAIREYLRAQGWPEPILADSGNGWHLLYRIDLPADDQKLTKRCLEALAARFNTEAADVDVKVGNASRICKFYGTVSRKGEPNAERPHRPSRVVELLEGWADTPVPGELLEALADELAVAEPPPATGGAAAGKGKGKGGLTAKAGNRDELYARAALRGEADAVASCPAGGRNHRLNEAAFRLGRFAGAKLLSDDEIKAALRGAAKAAKLGETEAEKTITSGFDAGKAHAWEPDERKDKDNHQDHQGNGHAANGQGNGTANGHHGSGGGISAGGFVGSVGASPPVSPEFQGGLIPLKGELREVHPLPQVLIPLPLRNWLTDIAHRGCFPIEYPAAAAIVGLSSLLGRNLTIRPKRRDSWTVVPNLWGAIIGPPGLQKTPAVEETFLPLRRLVAEAMEAHTEAERRSLEDGAIAEARASAAKKKLAEAAKKGAPDDELRRLVAEAAGPGATEAPTVKRYMVNDATVEKLGELLRENPRGLLQFRDELTGFFRSMDRQGHESDRGFYLETWPGNGSYTFDRIGRGTTHITGLCLSVFGTIQPGPLSRYLKGASSGEDADGFVPRFQILVYPDPPERFTNIDRWPDTEAKNGAYGLYRWIDSLVPAEMGAELDEDRGLYFLRFDDAAQDLFDEWREALENRLRSGTETAMMACHLSKYRSLMPSLALLFHVVASVGQSRLDPVTHDAALEAAAWCEVLESHARRVYQSAVDGDPEVAARLGERIKQSLPNPFTFRQVANKGWAGLDTVESVRQAVGILEDRNWAKVIVKPPGPAGGRPSEEVWINPTVMELKGGQS